MFFFKERVDFTFRTHVTREAPSPNTILTTDFALMEAAGAVSRISDEPREKNTCALEKKRKARRPRRVRLGLRPGPRHCHRLPLRRGWEQFLDLIPNSGEKQVIMATIRGLWVFFFYRESMFGQLLIIPSSLTTGIQVYFEKKPAGKTSFSLRIFLFYSYFCFLPEFFISALTGGYWKTKLTNWFHIRSITQRVTKTNYNWLNCGVPHVRFTA